MVMQALLIYKEMLTPEVDCQEIHVEFYPRGSIGKNSMWDFYPRGSIGKNSMWDFYPRGSIGKNSM